MITLDASELLALGRLADQQKLLVTEKAKAALRFASQKTVRQTKILMPKDTGRATASWGLWTAGDLLKPNPDAKAGDAIYRDDADKDLSITQGSNVPYVEALNSRRTKAGRSWSLQAPLGFLDMAFDAAQESLDNTVARLVQEAIL